MTHVQPWMPKWAEEQSEEAHELAREVARLLKPRARRRDPTITYHMLGKKVGRHPRDPVLHSALGLVTYDSLLSDGYALSALVVREDTGMPGEGFWGCINPDPHPEYWTKLRLFKEQLELISGRQL